MIIVLVVLGFVFAAAGFALFAWGVRGLAKRCVKHHTVGDDGLTDEERAEYAARWRRIAETAISPETRQKMMYLQPRRICCPTPPDSSHTGTCKNSLMHSGEERFFINE